MAIYNKIKCGHEEKGKIGGVLICKNCRKVLGVSKQEE
jgi:hypothetical protein